MWGVPLCSFRMFNIVIGKLEGISSNNVGKLRNMVSHSLQHEVTTQACLEDTKTQEFREFFALKLCIY